MTKYLTAAEIDEAFVRRPGVSGYMGYKIASTEKGDKIKAQAKDAPVLEAHLKEFMGLIEGLETKRIEGNDSALEAARKDEHNFIVNGTKHWLAQKKKEWGV